MSSIGIYNVQAGAKYDPISRPGLNYVMRCGLMLSNLEDSMFQFDRQLRSVGASFEHTEIRKQILGWKVEVPRDKFQTLFHMMCNCVAVPRFMEVEVQRYRDAMDAVYEEMRWKAPREYCTQRLECVGFYKEPLGQPRLVPPHSNDDCSPDHLMKQYCTRFLPHNMCIVGTNIDHDTLVAAYETAPYPHQKTAPHFRESEVPLAISTKNESAQFHPGRETADPEKRQKEMTSKPSMDNETISALGWIVPAGASAPEEYAVGLVTHQLLSTALQDGSRLEYGLDKGARTFYNPYETAGVFGLTIRSDPFHFETDMRKGIDIVQECAKGAKLFEQSFAHALHRAVVRFYHDNLELRRDYSDYVASCALSMSDSTELGCDVLDAIGNVRPNQVLCLLQKALNQAPCMFSTGEVDVVPSLRQLGLSN